MNDGFVLGPRTQTFLAPALSTDGGRGLLKLEKPPIHRRSHAPPSSECLKLKLRDALLSEVSFKGPRGKVGAQLASQATIVSQTCRFVPGRAMVGELVCFDEITSLGHLMMCLCFH